MTTLADVMLDVAEILGGVRVGTATGGSTTTLVDTSRTEPAEYWQDGTIAAPMFYDLLEAAKFGRIGF